MTNGNTDPYGDTQADLLLVDVLHQLSTDSDLDNVSAPEKYVALKDAIHAYLTEKGVL